MAEDGRLARTASRSASESEPSLSDLLDPVALEERLREARVRRAEALSRRPDPAAPARAALQAPAMPRRTTAVVPLLIFLAGLGLGGAVVAVLALRALPARVAATTDFAPAAAVAPPLTAAPAAAPVVPPAVAAAPSVVAAAPSNAAPTVAAAEADPPAESSRDPAGLDAPASEAAPPPAIALPRLQAALPPEPLAAALPARVAIHYPPSASEAAAAARDALSTAGVSDVEILPVRYAIGRSNIRYYHLGDRAPAAALGPLLAAALGGAAPEARDFTDYATPAAPGNVEIWLAGAPSGAPSGATRSAARTTPRAARSTPATAPDVPFQMPGVIAPPPTQAERVERILVERLRQGR